MPYIEEGYLVKQLKALHSEHTRKVESMLHSDHTTYSLSNQVRKKRVTTAQTI